MIAAATTQSTTAQMGGGRTAPKGSSRYYRA